MSFFNEVAIGSPRNRGLLIPEEQVIDVIIEHGENNAVYKSLYLYDEEAKEYFKIRKTLKDFISYITATEDWDNFRKGGLVSLIR